MKMKDKFQKALVTGGAGFIGSHLCEEMLKEGLEVVSVDNYFSGKAENLKELHENYGSKLTELNVDVTDYDALKKVFEDHQPDLVFHEAASKKVVCLNDPRKDLLINGTGTFNILELSRDFKVKKVVHASSGSIYGDLVERPQTEEHPLVPTSYYGVSKLAGEKYAKAFQHLYDLDTTVLRYFHVYGPRQEFRDGGGVVTIFGRRVYEGKPPIIFGDGTQQRSLTYVKDLVEINKLVALDERSKGEAYNCGCGINITIGQLAEMVKEYYGRTDLGTMYDDWTVGDVKLFDVSNEKIRKLGFEFKWPFKDGLKATLDWLTPWLDAKKAAGELDMA